MRLYTCCLIALIVIASACAAPDTPRIVLERADRDGWWRATYRLTAPADSLRFQRLASFYREDVWEVVTPGWRLGREGNNQFLVADVATDEIVVEFPVYTEHLPKEYEFFRTFTDGSLTIYTGHLYVTTDPPPPKDTEDDAEYLVRVELVPKDGEHVVVRGNLVDERTTWEDPAGDGTYVYFGTIEVLETDAMIGVVDPGTPDWLVEQLNRLLPKMFEIYADGFSEPLPWKPMVLFNFEDIDKGGLSSGGGTLSGLVQMSAIGNEWHGATPQSSEQLMYLIAHEAAHLWNSQLHGYVDGGDSWMHEGSADAFGELALLRTGTIDAKRHAERLTEALNLCVAGLADGALHDSGERRQFKNYYSCGHIIAVWSVAAVGGSSDLDGLFDVWRGVFALSSPDDSRYDRDSYFRALESLGVEADRIERLRAIVDEELDDPAAGMMEFLASAGIDTMIADRPAPAMRREHAAATLQHLMGRACEGRYSFNRAWPVLRTFSIEGCAPFDRALRVTGIQGYQVDTGGDRALEATAQRCRAGRPVTLELEGGETTRTPCTEPPELPSPPLAFGSDP